MKHKAFIFFVIIGVMLLFSAGCKKNKAPETPDKPDGPNLVGKGAPNEYKTKAHDPNGDDIRYIFDWGDNNTDTTDYYPSDSIAKKTHAWADTGTYVVKVRAQDEKNALSKEWSPPCTVRVVPNAPPRKPTIIGPPFGQPNIRYTFKTIVTDPESDSVAVKFFWGDGRTPTWTRFYASGDTIQDTITYTTEDTFAIKAVAKDKLGNISDTSDAFQFVVSAGVWSYITNEEFISSPALITNAQNRVTHIVIGCDDGFVYCLDSLGTFRWRYPDTANWTGASFNSSPCIGPDGTIYIGDEEGKLHAINSTNGTAKWTPFVASGSFYSSPAINATGDRIYIGSDNDTLFAINTADGTLAWAYGTSAGITASPAIASDGAIIFGDEGDSGRIYILNPDGTERHTFVTNAPIVSSPAISGSKIYFAAGDTLFYALDTNGVSYTTYLLAAEVRASPSVGQNGKIFFGCDDAKLYCLNPDLTGVWAVAHSHGEITSSVAISTDGFLYYVGDDNYLVEVNATTGNETGRTWKLGMTKGRKQLDVKSSPVIGPNGWIYAASEDGIYAFKINKTLANTDWPMFRHDIKHTGRVGGGK
ncbi:MAG: PQQ-binding-like beta-propeller repeat protein [candidate division WOR-3 bacterium]